MLVWPKYLFSKHTIFSFTLCTGTSLDSGEQRCLSYCMDRYMDTWNVVSKTYQSRILKERGSWVRACDVFVLGNSPVPTLGTNRRFLLTRCQVVNEAPIAVIKLSFICIKHLCMQCNHVSVSAHRYYFSFSHLLFASMLGLDLSTRVCTHWFQWT